MGIVQTGGVHGVGKTRTIHAAKAFTSKEAPILKGSEIMARNLGISVEELPSLDPAVRQAARAAMYAELEATTNGVRDGHFCVFTGDGGYEFPFSERDKGIVTAAVLVVASMETVLRRRLEIERERPKDPRVIEQHLALEHEAAVWTAEKLEVPLHIIHNEDGDNAPQELARVYDMYLD